MAMTQSGHVLLASALKSASGQPRFHIPIPNDLTADMAVGVLLRNEAGNGYERPFRDFFDANLKPGDVFVDVGAHFGLFALSAATRWPGRVDVLAVEPSPENLDVLAHAIAHNKLQDHIEIVPAALADKSGQAPLVFNTSMGHSLYGIAQDGGLQENPDGVLVSVTTLDLMMALRPKLQNRRLFLKIDVEGFEPQVVAGGADLLRSGHVAAILWEKGNAYASEPFLGNLRRMMAALTSLGFTHHRFADERLGGPLLPYDIDDSECNVMSLSASLSF